MSQENVEVVERAIAALNVRDIVEDSAPDFQIGVERVESVGASQVLAFLQVTASGRSSGIRQDAPSANVYDLVGGRISRIRVSWTGARPSPPWD